jgi:multidrug efflux pump subunit AcrA (membrane-fusion protein)
MDHQLASVLRVLNFLSAYFLKKIINFYEGKIVNMSIIKRKRLMKKHYIRTGVIALVVIVAGLSIYFLMREPANDLQSEESELQTATVRQGDLILRATGAGTLVAGSEVTIDFEMDGKLSEVLVKKGDSVEAGDLLARLEGTDTLEKLEEAEYALSELTSLLSIAEVKVTVAELEKSSRSARNYLVYLISPSIFYYEERLTEAQIALAEAQVSGNEEALADAEKAIGRAEANLMYYKEVYENEYVPDTFTVEEQDPDDPRKNIEVIYRPSEYDINNARNEIILIEEQLKAATAYLTALETGEIPEGAMGNDFTILRSAIQAVKAAKANLEDLNLYAPIPGVITSLNGQVGEAPDSGFITILDLYHPYLEIYIDASDWQMLKAGYEAEIVFDSYPDLVLTGEVSYVDPFITSMAGASLIYGQITLDEASLAQITALPIGSEATVDIIQGSAENAILVPVAALRKAGDQYSVFVARDGELEIRFVEVGLLDIYYAEVLSGLEVGEIVTTGIMETN